MLHLALAASSGFSSRRHASAPTRAASSLAGLSSFGLGGAGGASAAAGSCDQSRGVGQSRRTGRGGREQRPLGPWPAQPAQPARASSQMAASADAGSQAVLAQASTNGPEGRTVIKRRSWGGRALGAGGLAEQRGLSVGLDESKVPLTISQGSFSHLGRA